MAERLRRRMRHHMSRPAPTAPTPTAMMGMMMTAASSPPCKPVIQTTVSYQVVGARWKLPQLQSLILTAGWAARVQSSQQSTLQAYRP